MLVIRQNAKGGPELKKFPIKMDERSSRMGYKIGYCEGCNEPLHIPLAQASNLLDYFGASNELEITQKPVKKEPFRFKIIRALGGTVGDAR